MERIDLIALDIEHAEYTIAHFQRETTSECVPGK